MAWMNIGSWWMADTETGQIINTGIWPDEELPASFDGLVSWRNPNHSGQPNETVAILNEQGLKNLRGDWDAQAPGRELAASQAASHKGGLSLGKLLPIAGLALGGFGLAGMGPLAGLFGEAAGAGAGAWGDFLGGASAAEAGGIAGGSAALGDAAMGIGANTLEGALGGGSSMPVGGYDPANPLGFTSTDPVTTTMGVGNPDIIGAGLDPSLTAYGGGIPSLSGGLEAFPGAFGQEVNLNGGGLIPAGTGGLPPGISNLADLAKKFGTTENVLKSLITQAAGSEGSTTGSGSGAIDSLAKFLGIGTDTLKLLGGIGGTAASVYAANQQAENQQRLADQLLGFGADYRKRLADTYADPSAWLHSAEVQAPVQQGTDMLAHSLSTKGNPIGSPNALQAMQDYTSTQLFGKLGQERDRLAGFGGLTSYNAAAPGAMGAASTSGGNMWNALGAGINNIFSPPQTLMDQFKQMNSSGNSIFGSGWK